MADRSLAVAEESAEWVIGRIAEVGRSSDYTYDPDFEPVYRSSISELESIDRLFMIRAHNTGMQAVRDGVELDKVRGERTVRVRWGLTLPVLWEHHYQNVYNSFLPWMISSVMQSAFLKNPLLGETRNWRSR